MNPPTKKPEKEINIEIVVNPQLSNEKSPRAHRALLEKLRSLVDSGYGMRWYAYGVPLLIDDRFELTVTSLDDIYIK